MGRGCVLLTKDHVVRTYDFYAPIYDFLFGLVLAPGRKKMVDWIAAMPSMPDRVLEVGVGTGLTLPLYPRSIKVTGLDVSEAMLDKARKRMEKEGRTEVELHVMDAENMAFEDHSFDCIVVPYVLSVTPDPDRLVAELRRVCKVGGGYSYS